MINNIKLKKEFAPVKKVIEPDNDWDKLELDSKNLKKLVAACKKEVLREEIALIEDAKLAAEAYNFWDKTASLENIVRAGQLVVNDMFNAMRKDKEHPLIYKQKYKKLLRAEAIIKHLKEEK